MLVQIPNSHSLGLKTVNSSVTKEITPEQSPLSLTTSLKFFITQMHDCGFGLIGPRQVHAEYKMHTCKTICCVVMEYVIEQISTFLHWWNAK